MQLLLRSCLFLAVFSTAIIARSQPWTRITALPSRQFYPLEVIGTTLYAGANDTMFFSKDNGLTWTTRILPTGHGNVNAFSSVNDHLFVGTSKGIYMSDDEGVTWIASNISAPINQFVQWKGDLYAATRGEGVFVCSQAGNTWSTFNTGLTFSSFTDFTRIIQAGSSIMVFSNWGGGVASYDENLQKWTTTNLPISNSSGTEVLDVVKDDNTIYVQITDEKAAVIIRSEDSGVNWIWGFNQLNLQHGGNDGAMWRGYYTTYVFWNVSGVGSWIQDRANSSEPYSRWSNAEYFGNGYVFAARETDHRLFIAAASGVWSKPNGSPAVSVNNARQLPEILLFPNPALNGTSQIRAHGLTGVKITDVLGQVVFEESSIKDGQLKFKLNTPGIYYVIMLVNGQRISRSLQVM